MIQSNPCDCSGAFIHVKRTITITRAKVDTIARKAYERNQQVILKNYVSFTDYIFETNNTQADNAKDLYIPMPMYNLIEYNSNYAKTSARLWQYDEDDPNDNIADSEEPPLLVTLRMLKQSCH